MVGGGMRMSLSRIASRTAGLVLGSAKLGLGTFLTLHYVGGFVVCYGPSMEPTLTTGNILLTDHISPRLGWVGNGDIVVAQSPEGKSRVCKRIVAGPGETVRYKGKSIQVPEKHVWLQGDNKMNSNDSRHYGPVHVDSVRGRCYCRIWPDFHLSLFSSSPSSGVNYHLPPSAKKSTIVAREHGHGDN